MRFFLSRLEGRPKPQHLQLAPQLALLAPDAVHHRGNVAERALELPLRRRAASSRRAGARGACQARRELLRGGHRIAQTKVSTRECERKTPAGFAGAPAHPPRCRAAASPRQRGAGTPCEAPGTAPAVGKMCRWSLVSFFVGLDGSEPKRIEGQSLMNAPAASPTPASARPPCGTTTGSDVQQWNNRSGVAFLHRRSKQR